MNKEYFIKLTNNLYRLTLFFPKKEPLRYKMRELADDILAKVYRARSSVNSTAIGSQSIFEDLEVLDGFFEVAKEQNWVSPTETLKLQQEYSKLKEELKTQANCSVEVKPQPLPQIEENRVRPPNNGGRTSINQRQQKILGILKEKEKAQVWEFKKIFPEVTKRTLRRDFEQLLKQGFIERIGEKNNTFYQLKGRTLL